MGAARIGIIGSLVAGFLAFGMVAAMADTGAGQGQTPLSASLGFVVNTNGIGNQLNYNSDPNGPYAGFNVHCDGYTKMAFGVTKPGFPIVRVTATCTDQNGTTVYLKASFVDEGEPGTNDRICVEWAYQLPVGSNVYIHDMGTISSGNIQIHENNTDGTSDAQILSTQ
jgi:hypothetical protein